MKLSEADITEFKTNYDDGVKDWILPITAGHDNGMSGGEFRPIFSFE